MRRGWVVGAEEYEGEIVGFEAGERDYLVRVERLLAPKPCA